MDRFKKLRIYNGVMGFFHLAQGILMLWISNDFSVPIKTSYLSFDVAAKSIMPVVKEVTTVRVAPLVASFLFISALAHFLIATVLFKWYEKNLKKGANYARWWGVHVFQLYHDRRNCFSVRGIRPIQPDLVVYMQRGDDHVRAYDGAPQSNYTENRLDLIHFRLRSRNSAMDSHRDVFLWSGLVC